MPAQLNLMTTGAVAEKYRISITSVNYAITSDKVKAFAADSGSGRSVFLVDPDSAEERWGAARRRASAAQLPDAAVSKCVVRFADAPDANTETVTLARVATDHAIIASGGLVMFQDAAHGDDGAVSLVTCDRIGPVMLSVAISTPTMRPVFIQLSDDPEASRRRMDAALALAIPDENGNYRVSDISAALTSFTGPAT